MTPSDADRDHLTADEIAALGALLVAERPHPSQAFAAQLDARVAERFARPAPARAGARRRAGRARRWAAALRRPPFLPAAAATLAVALVALIVVLASVGGDGSGTPSFSDSSAGSAGSAPSFDSAGPGVASGGDTTAAKPERAAADAAPDPLPSAGAEDSSARKVERSASLELATPAAHVDAVAQDVLGVVARFDAIVDRSSVSSGTAGGGAQFALRIPAARLQPALAALSQLPDAHVVSRTDDSADVNQAYVTTRRRLANARAERAGVVRALQAADTEAQTLRLRTRLDALERTIALAERTQRALDRRVDYSRVTVAIRADDGAGSGGGTGGDAFTVGSAFHDALRVLEVAAGVLVIAGAALVPFALLLACLWPLARALGRRRREQALDAA